MNGDLTTAAYWDQTWTATGGRPVRLRERLRAAVHWKFDRMLGRLADSVGKAEADVLELGCAPGTILERLHRLRPRHRLHGLDFSPDGCRMARERLREAGVVAAVYEGDVRTAELPRRFDLVLSCGLIEHFADPAEMLRCHARFAAPGGWVAVTVPNFAAPVTKFFFRRFNAEVFATHNLAIMSEARMAEALRVAGLGEIAVGSAGGPQLMSEVAPGGLAAPLYRRAAQAWNVAAALLPGVLWQSNVWGRGRVVSPRASDQDMKAVGT